MPVGTIAVFAETVPPGNPLAMAQGVSKIFARKDVWLVCDGSRVGRRSYAELFAAVGHQFAGPHDDVTGDTFRLPDFRGRNPHGGTAVSDSEALLLGRLPLVHTEDMSSAQLPSHTHGGNFAQHATDALRYGAAAVFKR